MGLFYERAGGGVFAKPFNDWELEEMLCLLNTI